MKLFYLCLSILYITSNAHANSPDFSYSAADTAFSAGQVPTANLVSGNWYLIGVASNPDQSNLISGYWPDGKFTLPYNSGYFFQKASLTSGSDAFGNPSITWSERRYGAESRKIYHEYDGSGSINATLGLVIETQQTETVCAQHGVCKLIPAQSMLLCQLTVTDGRRECRHDNSENNLVSYMAYKQLNPAPRME